MSDRIGHDAAADASPVSCGGDCGTRRDFLRDGLMAVAALSAIVGGAAPLHAMTREYLEGMASAGTVTFPVPAADGATIDRANRLILIRYRGMVYACALECPHKGTMVQWEPQNARFYCPKHKSTFHPEGTRIQGKAPRGLDRYKVTLQGANVLVDTSAPIDGEANAAGWAAAGVKLG